MYGYSLSIANMLMNTVLLGTYPIRPVLFLCYVAIVVFAMLVFRTRTIAFQSRLFQMSVRSAVISATLLFLINGVLQVAVFNQLGIPQRDSAISMHDGEITTTRFTHIHFGKTVIATVVRPYIDRFTLRADTGSALLPFVPPTVIWIEMILFVIALLSMVVATSLYVSRLTGVGKQVAATVAIGLLGFVILEKSIDGGIVSDGAGLALCLWVCVMWFPVPRFLKMVPYLVLGYAWILFGLYLDGWYFPVSNVVLSAERAGILVLFVLSAVLYLHDSRRKALLSISTAVLCVGLFIYFNNANERAYVRAPISAGSAYMSVYPEELQPNLPKAGSIGSLNVYDASSLAPKSVGSVLQQYQLLPAYRPISVDMHECALPALLKEERFEVITPVPLSITDLRSTLYSFSATSDYPALAGWYRYRAVIYYNPCVVRYLDVIEQAIASAGSETAFVYDIELYMTPRLPFGGGDSLPGAR